MFKTAEQRVYIIAAALLLAISPLPGGISAARAQLVVPPINGLPDFAADDAFRRMEERAIRRREAIDARAQELPPADVVPTEDGLAGTAMTDEIAAQEGQGIIESGNETTQAAQSGAGDVVDATVQGADETADEASTVAGQIAASAQQVAALVMRPFIAEPGPNDWPVEKDVRLLLLDDAQLFALRDSGITIESERVMPTTGRTLVIARDADQVRLNNVIGELRQQFPDLVADFNHLYRFSTTTDSPAGVATAEEETNSGLPDDELTELRIGMIDGAVMQEHVFLRNRQVRRQDFVMNEGTRPLGHGSAVASLLVKHSPQDSLLLAASVFFETTGYAPGATTESIVAALDWLASENVDVINMSLSGPPNQLLEQVVRRMVSEGPLIVAAVGNNGPSGEPLYPAAYAGVIGATAIDRDRNIFRYANRGEHVDFAALGVNVKVADVSGSWRMESGTSMASPQIAVIVGQAVDAGMKQYDTLVTSLAGDAEDLGRKGFDKVFGYGLIRKPAVLVTQN